MREKLIELLDMNCGYVSEMKADALADYLISQGVIALPFKLGECVYDISEFVENRMMPEIYSDRMDYVCIGKRDGYIWIESPDGVTFNMEDFGKTFFTDEKQAEKEAEEWLEIHRRKI